MRHLHHFLIISVLTMVITFSFSSCEDENDDKGLPKVSYVRITNPASSDSLLVSAYQGSLIAVMGENLGSAVEVWFNDVQASELNPNYINDNSILVYVPSDIPQEITNQMRIVFGNGSFLYYDFKVEINKPQISRMLCEHVPDGEVSIIYGSYFYEPLTVTFPGNITVEPDYVEDGLIHVTVPEGATSGQIIVSNNFGKAESDFLFRDNRNIIISSDPFTGGWKVDFVVTNPGPEDPVAINGNYIRVKQTINSWGWIEVAGGPADAMGAISKNIPDEAILHPQLYNLKFEVNTRKPYSTNLIKLNFGLQKENNDAYFWNPPYDTKGKWETVIIPYDEMVAAYKEAGSEMVVNPDGYWTRVLFHGEGALDCDISFDNFRIVPKTIQ